MVHRSYIRNDFRSIVAHLIEELGEATAAAGKTVRWGPYSVNPEIPVHSQETNIVWLQRELDDVEGVIKRLRDCIEDGRIE